MGLGDPRWISWRVSGKWWCIFQNQYASATMEGCRINLRHRNKAPEKIGKVIRYKPRDSLEKWEGRVEMQCRVVGNGLNVGPMRLNVG